MHKNNKVQVKIHIISTSQWANMVTEFWTKIVERMTKIISISNTNNYHQKNIDNQVEDGQEIIHIIECQVVRDITKWKETRLKTTMNSMKTHLEAEYEEFQCQEDQFHT